MLGRPPGIGCTGQSIPFPSQQLNTALFTPPSYATASAALGSLISQISERLYIDKEDPLRKNHLIGKLTHKVEIWRHELPGHLHPESITAPSFTHATFYLGLKYNYARMLIGRLYLTHSVLCSKSHDPVFNSRVEICETANCDSVKFLQKLYEQGLLTTSLWFDTYFVICTALILFLCTIKDHSVQEELQSLLPILRMCTESNVGKYAAEKIEKYLRNLEFTKVENHTGRIADMFFQHLDLGQDPASSCMSISEGSSRDITLNSLEDADNIPLECFDFGRDFGLQLCQHGRALEL